MYITSAARLRLDTLCNINNLRIEQKRKMYNNSWSMTLPFDDWHMPDLQTQNRSSWWLTHFSSSCAIHTNAFKPSIQHQQTPEIFITITIIRFCSNFIVLHTATTLSMDAADYWPMAREYSIWNAFIASLQFWAADLDPVTLGRATECVYATFFYSPSSHTFHQWSDEILFGHFVITLNADFDQQLSLADEGYESGSDTIDLPTPLRKTPRIHHVFSMEHTSFDPVPVTPHSTPHTPHRPVCRCLSFSSADSYIPDSTPECSEDEQEDFHDGTSGWWTLDFWGNTWKDIMYS